MLPVMAWLGARWALPLLMAALAVAAGAAYTAGSMNGRARCVALQAEATQAAQARADVATAATITRATSTGQARERSRAAIDRVFSTLAQEAADEAADPAVDACVLPAERLRRWAAANAGAADPGAATSQPDGAAAALAGPGLRPHARPGSQPPPGGPGLSPAGQPDVRAAGVLAGSAP